MPIRPLHRRLLPALACLIAYKISGLPWGRKIHGRTAAQMAGEIPHSQRLHSGQLEPDDLLGDEFAWGRRVLP